jgi:hypothetical protein
MKDGDDARPFSPILSLPSTLEPGSNSSADSEELELSDSEIAFLSEFIDPTYLDKEAIAKINSRFCDDSSVQLKNFLNSEISKKIFEITKKADTEDLLGEYILFFCLVDALNFYHRDYFLRHSFLEPCSDNMLVLFISSTRTYSILAFLSFLFFFYHYQVLFFVFYSCGLPFYYFLFLFFLSF